MENSRYKDLYKHLKQEGFSVYTPGQKTGECTAPYVVIKDTGTAQFAGFSSTQSVYDLMCYVPKDKYTDLDLYVDSVEVAMKGLYPMFKSAHYRTPAYYDESCKAYMVSTQYYNYKKFNNN